MHGSTAMDTGTLESRYSEVCERIAAAARRSGRLPEDVILVAVSKGADPEQIRALLELGHRDLGENRVQQLVQRAAMVEEYIKRLRVLPNAQQERTSREQAARSTLGSTQAAGVPESVRWHMIGHLQRNKARKAVELCRLIHSVDSLRLAEEVQVFASRHEHPVEVLVQVNCSLEGQKFGCPIAAALPLCEQIETMVNVRVRGLMTMAAEGRSGDARGTFARCRELFEELTRRGVGEGRFNLLSMGMSGDYEAAIEEGANIVRVGTAIFGASAPEEPGVHG